MVTKQLFTPVSKVESKNIDSDLAPPFPVFGSTFPKGGFRASSSVLNIPLQYVPPRHIHYEVYR